MSLLRNLILAIVFILSDLSVGHAEDPSEIWVSRITPIWLDEHVDAGRGARPTDISYTLARTQVWTSGLAGSAMQAFETMPFDKTVGAKLQPFRDYDLMVGTELTRDGAMAQFLSSKVNWEAAWSRDWQRLGGLTFGLSAGGSMGNLETGYSQSVGGTLGVPLRASVDMWSTEFHLSPHMNVDTASGAIETRLTSELVSRTVLSSRADTFKSVLNVKAGYSVAPDARPAASARLELKISPNF